MWATQTIAEFLGEYCSAYFPKSLGPNFQYAVAAIIHAVLLVHVFAVCPGVFIWL